MSEPETEKLRYGRARLTVAKTGPLSDDDRLGRALDAYEKGEARPATVANAYLRARVIEHSPSFRWRGARLGELIPLITAVSADPAIEAETSRELADALVRGRRAERAEAPPPPEEEEEDEEEEAEKLGEDEPEALEDEPEEEEIEPEPPEPPKPEPERPELRPRPSPVPTAARPRPAAPSTVRRRRLIALGGLGGVLLLAIVLVANHLGGVPDRFADEYRERAAPAVKRIAESMDVVFDNFDLYLAGYERGMAENSIRAARETIDEEREPLAEAPDAPLIGGGDAVEDVDEARASAAAYVDASIHLLERFRAFLRLDESEAAAEARSFYLRTVALAEAAEALEERVFSLGSGDGDADGTDHYRPAPPSSLTDAG